MYETSHRQKKVVKSTSYQRIVLDREVPSILQTMKKERLDDEIIIGPIIRTVYVGVCQVNNLEPTTNGTKLFFQAKKRNRLRPRNLASAGYSRKISKQRSQTRR
jgi:hypothetical protein